jgi:hypothetical protein
MVEEVASPAMIIIVAEGETVRLQRQKSASSCSLLHGGDYLLSMGKAQLRHSLIPDLLFRRLSVRGVVECCKSVVGVIVSHVPISNRPTQVEMDKEGQWGTLTAQSRCS